MQSRWVRFVLALGILVLFSIPASAANPDEYSVFISGFTAFQKQEYATTVERMTLFLKEYPSTPLRDMALFWLARAHFRLGHREEAARYMARFLRENPDTPLRNAVEEELVALAKMYDKGEPLPAPAEKPTVVAQQPPSISPDKERIIRTAPVPAPKTTEKTAKTRARRKTGTTDPSMKERAIAEYRAVQEKYPGTRAAAAAAERLEKLGAGQPAPVQTPIPSAGTVGRGANAQVVDLEVGQFAAADFSFSPYAAHNDAGAGISLPFEVVNRGNAVDSFSLETGFPQEFGSRFAAAGGPGVFIRETPPLAPGESFKGIMTLTVPAGMVDGQKVTHSAKLVSKFDPGTSLSRDISLVSRAPLLRMVVKPDRERVTPGETVTYRIALLNIGSAAAKRVSFTLSYPSQYEPIDSGGGGLKKESKLALVSDEMGMASGENREFTVAFRLRDEALSGQELFCRAEVENRELRVRETFLSPVAVVGRVSGVSARSASERLNILPGQRVVIPLTVINTGNDRETVTLKPSIPPSIRYAIFRNAGDGARQADQPISESFGPLSPREEASLKLELHAPADAADNSDVPLSIAFVPQGNPGRAAVLSFRLVFSRPVVEMEMKGGGGRLKPGEIAHLELSIVNRGSNTAKDVEIRSMLPERLEIVGSEPAFSADRNRERVWLFPELGPGERRNIVLAYKVKPGVAAGTSLRIETSLRYRDQQGNSY